MMMSDVHIENSSLKHTDKNDCPTVKSSSSMIPMSVTPLPIDTETKSLDQLVNEAMELIDYEDDYEDDLDFKQVPVNNKEQEAEQQRKTELLIDNMDAVKRTIEAYRKADGACRMINMAGELTTLSKNGFRQSFLTQSTDSESDSESDYEDDEQKEQTDLYISIISISMILSVRFFSPLISKRPAHDRL